MPQVATCAHLLWLRKADCASPHWLLCSPARCLLLFRHPCAPAQEQMALHAIGAHTSSYRPVSCIDLGAVMLGSGKGCADADSVLFESLRLACTSEFPPRSLCEEETFGQPEVQTDSGGQPDSGGLCSSAPDLPERFVYIQAALFPPEVGQPSSVPQQPVAAEAVAVVPAYVPPTACAAGGKGSALVGAAACGQAAFKTYAPAKVGAVGGGTSRAPQGTSKSVSKASAALDVGKCRPYWPAYSEAGHPVPPAAGGLPVIRPTAAAPPPKASSCTAAARALPEPTALPPPPATELGAQSWDEDVLPTRAPAADAASTSWGGMSVGSSRNSAVLKVSFCFG